MRHTRTLTSLVTAATAAIIALSSVVLAYLLNNPFMEALPRTQQVWPMVLATSTATLLVMSMLHSNLNRLYARLAISEARAREDARRDALTRLGNRKFLMEEIQRRLSSPEAGRSALLFIDLDQFKRVNDTLGHAAGDELIIKVAERLRACAPDAFISRLGGDEFALIVNAASAEDLARRCDEILEAISGAYLLGGTEVRIGASLGSVIFDRSLKSSEMMRRADIAMYRAKAARTGWKQFDQEMFKEIEHRALLERRLRHALKSGTVLTALFQPQVDRRGRIVALEALLRWHDEQLGDVSPLEAVAVAEEAQLIDELGLFMVEQACIAANALPDLTISLNLASMQLLDYRFSERLTALIRTHGVGPDRIQLEIPERVFVEGVDEIDSTLRHLTEAGFQLAVDNYGTSNSNLSHLRQMAIGAIKLDQSLLNNTHEFGSVAVMRARVALAKSLGLSVACCGVGDERDRSAALQAGCDLLQGFFFSRPKPLEAFVADAALGSPDAAACLAGTAGAEADSQHGPPASSASIRQKSA